jgi:hypothetical protein
VFLQCLLDLDRDVSVGRHVFFAGVCLGLATGRSQFKAGELRRDLPDPFPRLPAELGELFAPTTEHDHEQTDRSHEGGSDSSEGGGPFGGHGFDFR